MKEKCKITCINVDNEILECLEWNKKELQYRMIKKCRDSLVVFKKTSEETEKKEITRENRKK